MTTINSNPNRVLRGGSWRDVAWYCRSAFRDYYVPGYRSQNFGFRPVLKQKTQQHNSQT